MLNPLKYFRNRTTGLVLGSGGAKGLSHIAVAEYLESMGITVDLVVGSSIGAVVGALYCSGTLSSFKEDIISKTVSELLSYFDPVFPRSGLIEGKECMEYLESFIPPNTEFEDLHIPLAVVSTDYYTGETVVFRSGNVHEAVRASISIPGVFVPVRYKGTLLIDGGVANPLPVNIARGMGAGLTVAVNLHPTVENDKWKKYVRSRMDKSHRAADARDVEIIKERPPAGLNIKELSSLTKPANWVKTIEQWMRPQYDKQTFPMPNIFEVIMQTIDIMEFINTKMMLRYNTPTVLIEPQLADVGTLDFNKAQKIITQGYIACSKVQKELVGKIQNWR